MAHISYVLAFILSVLFLRLLCLAQEDRRLNIPRCPPFRCGFFGNIGFPFSNRTHRECGLLVVDNCTEPVPSIQLGKQGQWFNIQGISQDNTLQLYDNSSIEERHKCSNKSLKNLTLPISPFLSFNAPKQAGFLRCPLNYTIPKNFTSVCNNSQHSVIRYTGPFNVFPRPPPNCSWINFQVKKNKTSIEYSYLFTGFFPLEVNVTDECYDCFLAGGKCKTDSNGNFNCSVTGRTNSSCITTHGEVLGLIPGNGKRIFKLHLGIGLGVGGSLIVAPLIFIIWRCKKQKHTSTGFNSRNGFSDPSSRSEMEMGVVYFGVPIFSYSELAKATNNFSDEKILGNGGFATVYYAKLRDGREVAVKRLNEYNYRRVKQFMTEVEILTRLRHKNLVSLYGCTSQHSQQGLLLVYEYVPNGTVADHLRGDPAKISSLTWPIRLKIAIETASALAYLHASDFIHRDVKTKNILLDNNFSVKVADFGLSRFFPADVTHVSTAPQGSPGYVDPEYYHCYQLTDRSDVYSFGVVLIELISSMPAIDKKRQRHEINLGNFAINRIEKYLIEELVDTSLGYQSDEQVRRMITSVAELAFLCLQQSKEMRPPMDVVLEELKRIESGNWILEDVKEEKDNNDVLNSMQTPPDYDNLALLKHKRVPSSPISVAAKPVNSNTRLNVSY